MTHDIDVTDLTDDALHRHLTDLGALRDTQEADLRETTAARNLAIIEIARRQIHANHPGIAALHFELSDGDPSEGIAPRLIFETACGTSNATLDIDEEDIDLGPQITMGDLEMAINDLENEADHPLVITNSDADREAIA